MMREDWVEVELGMVCEKAEIVKRKETTAAKSFKYFDIGGIDNVTNRIVGFKEYRWENAPSRAQQIIKKGDVLFSTVRTYLKNIAQVDKELYNNEICSSGFTVLRGANGVLLSNYLFHYSLSLSFLNPLNKLQTGTSYPAVRDKDVFAQTIPLAPLPIQRAIVLKIENLFASLDKGIADLKTAQAQLKVYRQAVLKKAFEGGFTCKNVKDGELPAEWRWGTFNDVCIKIGDIDHKMPKQVENGGLPYISTKDFTDDLKISFENAKYISEEDFHNLARKIKPEKGDIIFPRYGTIGKNILVDFNKDFLVSYSCAVVKPNYDKIDSKYLYYFSLSPLVKDEIKKYVVETTQANIGIASIKKFILPLPKERAEQHAIVREIETRLSVCDKVEQSIIEALEKAEALRQSILKKAFEGKLLSEAEIARCKQEKDYEPASVLLEKIKQLKKR